MSPELNSDPVFFGTHLYHGDTWNGFARSWIATCLKALDPDKARALEASTDKLPPRLRAILHPTVDGVADRIEAFRSTFLTEFPNGCTQASTRALLRQHGLDDYGVAAKTWLDELAAQGLLRMNTTRSPRTYHITDHARTAGWAP